MTVNYAPHWRVSFGGSLWVDEQWQCSLKLRPDTDGPWANPATWMSFAVDKVADAASVISGVFSANENGWSPAARLEWVKLVPIKSDGTYLMTDTTPEHQFGTAVSPGSFTGDADTPAAPQLAIVVSLLSQSVRRGPGSHGRIFIPPVNIPLTEASPSIGSANAAKFMGGVRGLVDSLNNLGNSGAAGPVHVANCSSQGACAAVDKFACGDLYDTQRRRRRQLHEVYATQNL